MLNYIWLGLIVIAVVTGAATGNIQQVTKQAFDSAETAVKIALGLISIMTLWLGIMKIAEQAGFIRMLARALAPVMRRLFPEVPPEHPAMGAMLLNIAANWLGLSNAATPFGLKAMEELQQLNPKKRHRHQRHGDVPRHQHCQHHSDSEHDHRHPGLAAIQQSLRDHRHHHFRERLRHHHGDHRGKTVEPAPGVPQGRSAAHRATTGGPTWVIFSAPHSN